MSWSSCTRASEPKDQANHGRHHGMALSFQVLRSATYPWLTSAGPPYAKPPQVRSSLRRLGQLPTRCRQPPQEFLARSGLLEVPQRKLRSGAGACEKRAALRAGKNQNLS